MTRFLLVIARAIDYRIGLTDEDKPHDPVLKMTEAWSAFFLKLLIILVNFITSCYNRSTWTVTVNPLNATYLAVLSKKSWISFGFPQNLSSPKKF